MRISCREAAARLGIHPFQFLVELAAMDQPAGECYPQVDEGFVETVRAQRRVRMGFTGPPRRPAPAPAPERPAPLPVSDLAAAILDKLERKGYGLKSVRVFTLVQKWVHGADEEHVRELVDRGYLKWADPARQTVHLAPDRLGDTEELVEAYRRKRAAAGG